MTLTAKEEQVVQVLRHRWVATKETLCRQLQVSHMTVVRGLHKYGYYTSDNHNSAYYTLRDIPTFDAEGLWLYQGIGFSRFGTLQETLVTLVERSPAGCAVCELESRLQTRVANLLCLGCRQQRLACYYVGRQAVYVSRDPEQQARQKQRREQQREEALRAARPLPEPGVGFPEGVDAKTVIALLVERVKRPQASPASLSQTLQARGISVSATQVRAVLTFYALEKKRAV